MPKNPGGRPRHGGEVKTAPLNMRTTPQLRAKVEAAAAKSGRSLSREVEIRLELSFRDDEWRNGKTRASEDALVWAAGCAAQNDERTKIAAFLRYFSVPDLADVIERGEHLAIPLTPESTPAHPHTSNPSAP